MLDENRIKLMSRMASYEENEGKKTIPIASFFRGDYISYNVVKTAISATVAFIIVTAAYIYYHMEDFLGDVYKLDINIMGRNLLMAYIVFVAIYCVIALVVYSLRYDRAKKSLNEYYQALKRLSIIYEDEEQSIK